MAFFLLCGQSLALEMQQLTAAGDTATPHADCHMWNSAGSNAGNAWVTPTGSGLIAMLNAMRAALSEPVYVVVAATGGTGLLPNDINPANPGCWTDTAAGSLINNAIASVNAAIATLPSGTKLDRIEYWGMQQDCFALGYSDMYSACLSGLATLRTLFQAAFGTDVRLCIWPLGQLPSGQSQQVLRAQLVFTGAGPGLTPTQGVEPGPASHDQPRRTGEPHLASYITMGIRGALNAVSHLQARAADPAVGWHGGCGPIAISLQRNGYVALVYFAVKPGSALQPANPWATSNVNQTTNWGLWWFNWGDIRATLVSGLIVGPYVQIVSNTPLNYPIRAGHAWEQDCAGPDIYTEDGQLGLPITPEMLLSG